MTGPVFAQLPVEVFRDARLSARDLRILGLLYAFANREGRCWPSRRQLAALSGLPLGRVSTTTTRLARFGWLTKTGNGGRSRACRYRLHRPETLPDAVAVPEAVTVTEAVTQTVAEAVTKTVTPAGNGHGTDQEQTREQTTGVAEPPGRYTMAFDHFWSAYPRRRHKGAAMKAWRKLRPGAGAYLAHRRIGLFWLVAAIALAGPWALKGCKRPATLMEGCTVSSVYDGDTLRAECGGEQLKVRLHCIDAPEMGQKPWGRESRDYLRALVPRDSAVSLKVYDTDKYGRRVADVLKNDENQNALMVKAGHAAVYRTYCTRANRAYYRGEEQARQGRLGILEKPGLQQRPWEWRSNGS